MPKERLPKTKKFFEGVLDVIESAANAKAEEDEKNKQIEEAVRALMENYTGNRLVLVDKDA